MIFRLGRAWKVLKKYSPSTKRLDFQARLYPQQYQHLGRISTKKFNPNKSKRGGSDAKKRRAHILGLFFRIGIVSKS